MKKNLIVALALVFVLGIAGTAFAAANPFVDVPAKHWAYDAVSKLAKAGILDGYGDGTYRGERLASRYEMAQATAKAMARADKADAQMKALIDKLAVEFAAELNNLGVRVAKLEKNASTIKFWGDARLRFMSNQSGLLDASGNVADSMWDQRVRVYAKADVNDKASFYGRLMANWRDVSAYGSSYSSGVYWDYGYFEWTFNPQVKLAIGRQAFANSWGLFNANGGYDAVTFKYAADKFSANIAYGDIGTYNGASGLTVGDTKVAKDPVLNTGFAKPLFLLDMYYKMSKDWTVNGGMYWGTNADNAVLTSGYTSGAYTTGYPFEVYALGAKGKLNEDFSLQAQYFWNNASKVRDLSNDQHNGWLAEVWYRGAQATKVGSWGIGVNYSDIKPWAMDIQWASGILGNSMNTADQLAYGRKGFGVSANYTISKNAVLTATYEGVSRNSAADSTKLLPFYYVQLNVGF